MKEYNKIKIIPKKELYYGNDFGVYACEADKDIDIIRNKYGNFVISGEIPRLALDQEYIVDLQETIHKKYGRTYVVKYIRQELPKTKESQHEFLRLILPVSYAEAIIEAYPDEENIIELIRTGKLNYEKIKGISHITFARIQNKVNENIEVWEVLDEFSQLGITPKIIKRIIKHFGSPSIAVQKAKENIYCLCDVEQLGFKKVDTYALKNGVEKDSPYRIIAATEYYLQEEENENGHCWIEKEILIKKVSELTEVDKETVQNIVNNENFNQEKRFYIDDQRIGLYKNYYYESEIAKYISELLKVKNNFVVENINEKIQKIEEEQGFKYTDEQRNAILMAIENNFLVISGRAGSGKTSILKGIIKLLNKYTYQTCALSGKAAQRIIESTGLKSKTIHRLLGYHPEIGFTFNKHNKLTEDIIVLDEASMVNNQLFYNLISAVKTGGKMIIIGDIEQLPPIGAGTILKDLIDSGTVPVIELTQVHRQALKSGILLNANEIRDGKQITQHGEYGNKIVGELADLHLYSRPKGYDIQSEIISLCEKVKDKVNIMEFQVIVPMKTRGSISAKELNLKLQPIFNPNTDEGLKRNGYEFKVGDKIIKRGNDYVNDVFNGTLGIIKWIDLQERKAGFEFVGIEKEVVYYQDDLDEIDMAYALTCHSTQGSQFENVLLALDFSAYMLLYRQWPYTGLTRASKKCVFIFENEALRMAIRQNGVVKRNTFLRECLIKQRGINEI